ncbi:GSK3B-interacting protein [Halotydeus destructor]|nr:GSK3B-interacting protein [Halotydeus destructor]
MASPGSSGERFLMSSNASGSKEFEGWRSEALAVKTDTGQFVKSFEISEELPINESGIYLNIETKECKKYTVELSTAGFRICGEQFNTINELSDSSKKSYFETPYVLLDSISPSYRENFSGALADKLNALLPQ